ncbi:MAG: tRNA 2-thiocytidine biosynthesis TtcA family protein [Lachnospiraceae bacterium]
MQLQQLLSYTRQAVDDYEMIREGDVIAVGISGGKDSLTLLYALHGLKRFYPKSFQIHAISIDLGFENVSFDGIKKLCDALDIPYTIIKTQIGAIIFEERKEKNPCALCANMRRGAMNRAAIDLGCNKIAYGHQKDDLVETFMMSLMYEGRIHCYSPITSFDDIGLTVIRPLLYVKEADVKGFVKKQNLPILKSPCPADGNTKRSDMRDLLRELNKSNKGVKDKIFHAIIHQDLEGWPKKDGGV